MPTVHNLGLNRLTEDMVAILEQSGMVTPVMRVSSPTPLLPRMYEDNSPMSVRKAVMSTLDRIPFETGDVCIVSAPDDVTAYVVTWFIDHIDAGEDERLPMLITPLGRYEPKKRKFVVKAFREIVFSDDPERTPCHIMSKV